MIPEIRQTVTLAGRTLHLRRFGAGPPVVLLHESPRSSAVLLPLAGMLAADFTVFALDTPGYGVSDPLPLTRPNVEDYADAVTASLRALGLTRAAVYGTHTGAAIALAMAKRHPDLVAGGVLDGYPVFTTGEGDLHAYHYLPGFEAAWDGSHVARLWSRVRDQYTFFPWYQPGRDSRLRRDPPGPAQQNAVIRDLLAAGPSYAPAYAAAFRADGVAALADVVPPVCIMCREDDLLFPHLDRLPALPASMAIVRLGANRPAWGARIGRELGAMIGAAAAPAPVFGLRGTPQEALCALDGTMLARCYDTGARDVAPLVLVHDLPGRSKDWHAVALRESERRLVVALDLPGAGVSPEGSDRPDDVAALATRIVDLLAASGITSFDLGGHGLGAILALAVARLAGPAAGQVVLLEPPPPASDEAPVRPAADWHGGHLMAAWYEARDRMLFRPWHARGAVATREIGPGVDVATVAATFEAIVLADESSLALAAALSAEAPGLADRDLTRCHVVLRAGDPDETALGTALAGAGAHVTVCHYDMLADHVVAAFEAGPRS